MFRNLQDVINEAKITLDYEKQREFANHSSSYVRKALAINKNIYKEFLDKLCFDCTVNVSYFAINNKRAKSKRNLREEDIQHMCVSCTKDIEDIINCQRCPLLGKDC